MASTEADASQAHIQPPDCSRPAKLPPKSKGSVRSSTIISGRKASDHAARRIYVTASTPFRSITTRVRKQLDKSLRQASATDAQSITSKIATRSLPLSTRIQRLQEAAGSGIGLENARQVVVIGTGRAIEKVLNVAAFFQKQGDVDVRLKTGSVGVLDQVELEVDVEETERRERMISCLEASVRLK